MYEPSGSGVEQIKEEAEEEDVPEEQQEEVQAQPQEQFVPSWMQATSNAPAPNDPHRE